MKTFWKSCFGEDAISPKSSPESAESPATKDGIPARTGGLSFGLAAFFMVAQMAGAGFLTLPRAMSNAGWTGLALIILFCVSICFSGIRLGRSYVILEERWPLVYSKPVRQPYMEIAYRALGIHGRRFCLFCIMFSLIGSTIVYAILTAELLADLVPSLSQCHWICIVGALLIPLSWLGSPKDFWQASVLAVVATIVAIIVIVVKIIVDYSAAEADFPVPVYRTPTLFSFSLGFGAILFAYSGASVFPTIQNDMRDRSQFSKSAISAFVVIGSLYVPVAITGYYYIGSNVNNNILLSITSDIFVQIAIGLQVINLIGTFMIAFNPPIQSLEDLIGIPKTFCWQRVLIRTTVVLFEIFIGLAIPDFGLILNLIGGSTVTCLSFIFPPLVYMKLVDDKSNPEWPQRSIPLWQRIYLYIIIIIGVTGGICATISALMSILSPESFGKSCFLHFGLKNLQNSTDFLANSTKLTS